jgi:hypothetical protein
VAPTNLLKETRVVYSNSLWLLPTKVKEPGFWIVRLAAFTDADKKGRHNICHFDLRVEVMRTLLFINNHAF